MGSYARKGVGEYEVRERLVYFYVFVIYICLMLNTEGEVVRWSLKGDRFVVQSGKVIDIYSTVRGVLLFSAPPY